MRLEPLEKLRHIKNAVSEQETSFFTHTPASVETRKLTSSPFFFLSSARARALDLSLSLSLVKNMVWDSRDKAEKDFI